MKKHPRAFHPSEPRYKYPLIKDDLWDLEEDAPPIKTAVNRKLALDDETTSTVADNSKYTLFNIILTISTVSHFLFKMFHSQHQSTYYRHHNN